MTTPAVVRALDRVGHQERGDRAVGAPVLCERAEHTPDEGCADERSGRVVHEHGLSRIAGPGRRERPAHRLRADRPALHRGDARGTPCARRQREHDLLDLLDRAQHVDAPLEERTAGQLHERLGAGGAEALAAPGGHDQRDGHRCRGLSCTRPATTGATACARAWLLRSGHCHLARGRVGEQLVEVVLRLLLVLVERIHEL